MNYMSNMQVLFISLIYGVPLAAFTWLFWKIGIFDDANPFTKDFWRKNPRNPNDQPPTPA